jgi:histidinol-phosphate aminotransferase
MKESVAMPISRRSLLRRMGAGAAAAVAAPCLAEVSLGATLAAPVVSLNAVKPEGPIRLHRNESAYGASHRAIAAMQEAAMNGASRYPDVDSEALRTKIASLHGVTADRVVLGCGSSEILRMAVDAFVGSGRGLISAVPTFELIGRYARRAGAEVVGVPLTRNYAHDLDGMFARANAATGLVYICNPNNPTGTLTRRPELEAFLRRLPATAYVLIDEAYDSYVGRSADYASFIDRPVDDPRLIVTRTFSTVYGLAAARVGYAVAAPQAARLLASAGLPDNVNLLAAVAAIAALDDADHVWMNVQRNADERQEFFNQTHARMLRPIDSQTNFVMVNAERPAVDVVEHFKARGILVSGPFPAFDTYIRVSLGTSAEMREFWRVWDLLPVHNHMSK